MTEQCSYTQPYEANERITLRCMLREGHDGQHEGLAPRVPVEPQKALAERVEHAIYARIRRESAGHDSSWIRGMNQAADEAYRAVLTCSCTAVMGGRLEAPPEGCAMHSAPEPSAQAFPEDWDQKGVPLPFGPVNIITGPISGHHPEPSAVEEAQDSILRTKNYAQIRDNNGVSIVHLLDAHGLSACTGEPVWPISENAQRTTLCEPCRLRSLRPEPSAVEDAHEGSLAERLRILGDAIPDGDRRALILDAADWIDAWCNDRERDWLDRALNAEAALAAARADVDRAEDARAMLVVEAYTAPDADWYTIIDSLRHRIADLLAEREAKHE